MMHQANTALAVTRRRPTGRLSKTQTIEIKAAQAGQRLKGGYDNGPVQPDFLGNPDRCNVA
jgi:hypothetical protein